MPFWGVAAAAAYALVLLLILACAAYSAIFDRDRDRRKDAYRVFRLVVSAGGTTALVGKMLDLPII
ncbi:hypothetical protein BAY60_36105 (plasmid) [Prauserella muralis]|uniref:Uncharacterized protein n=1 Tax=Prauserella muralis TaxID=588067 RepID=A0A2V4ABY0_9PSEU|nr:hypothetical protein BAY60_36105 [Prauserella muralis]TWE11134.1 hypothetical protein FHX69_7353 [Prauserella muralis]